MNKTLKRFMITLFSAILIFALAGCASDDSESSSASAADKAVLEEMNFARTNPAGYILSRLTPLKSSYSGTKLSALNELISEMQSMTALTAYQWGDGLYQAADEWVQSQGSTTQAGHDSNIWKRIKKYCSYTSAGENLSYGYSSAKDIVIQLLVDDGVETRGHRKNILSTSFTHAGCSIGSHKQYRNMCCIDFAGGYSE